MLRTSWLAKALSFTNRSFKNTQNIFSMMKAFHVIKYTDNE